MVTTLIDSRRAWNIAAQVPDPEMPMLTLADLGVLRGVEIDADGSVVASLTPTYSGCPAMAEMRAEVAARLRDAGFAKVEIRTVLDPPWSTDWITPKAAAALPSTASLRPARPPRPGQAHAVTDPPYGCLPALRLGRHRGDLALRRDLLQSPVAVPRLPRAVRVRQGDLMASPDARSRTAPNTRSR